MAASVPSAGPARRRQPTPHGVLAIATFGAFLAFLNIINVIFPGIRDSFPLASLATLSWVLNGYSIAFATFVVAAGRLADVLGRRRLFIAGVGLFVIASGGCAAASTVGQLIAFRLAQGVGAALMVPTSLALVMEAWPRQRHSQGTSLWAGAAAVGIALACRSIADR